MFGWERLVLLRHRWDDCLTKTAIGERLGVTRQVINDGIANGQLDREESGEIRPRVWRAPLARQRGICRHDLALSSIVAADAPILAR